jgi:serpin B
MKKYLGLWALLVIGVWGCAGSSTGNPADAKVVVPKGAQLVMSDAPRQTEPTSDDTAIKTLGSDNRAFAFDLYTNLAKDNTNLFFSPFSISVALAMTYAGAENQTESEMKQTLHFSLPEPNLHDAFDATDRALKERATQVAPVSKNSTTSVEGGDGFTLNIFNQAWGQKDFHFLDSYLDVLATYYGAGLFLVDFADSEPARKLINGWVYEQTMKKVKDLLPAGSIDSNTALVLTNAIYFKASWQSKFNPNQTKDGVFHAPEADRTVPMMHKTLLEASYAEGDGYQAVELPYLSESVRMLVLLPAEGKFDTVASGLNDAFLQQVLSAMSETFVILTMPRFTFESENKLSHSLKALGMVSAFEDADFSGINRTGGIWIDEVYHKAFIAVDEEGTEAAAATAVGMKAGVGMENKTVTLDRPFIFLIYDEPTGQVLFLGHLKDPAP